MRNQTIFYGFRFKPPEIKIIHTFNSVKLKSCELILSKCLPIRYIITQ